jgi:hypothetical protein
MKDYKKLMTDSTQQRIDTAIKYGAAIAVVCFLLVIALNASYSTVEPLRKAGV